MELLLEGAGTSDDPFEDAPLVIGYVPIALGSPFKDFEDRPSIHLVYALQLRAPFDGPVPLPESSGFPDGVQKCPIRSARQRDRIQSLARESPRRLRPLSPHGMRFLLDEAERAHRLTPMPRCACPREQLPCPFNQRHNRRISLAPAAQLGHALVCERHDRICPVPSREEGGDHLRPPPGPGSFLAVAPWRPSSQASVSTPGGPGGLRRARVCRAARLRRRKFLIFSPEEIVFC